ncbi:esterase-like activity of phytase family protein [Solimonas soli]|uniref:esterase-like activity of phytase family protein n=1 Tax=Solimonas soli TaxID=413479 RepID=UPI0004BAF3E5|nr:esterase-like activity of phytase family protein [Solimonas soli]
MNKKMTAVLLTAALLAACSDDKNQGPVLSGKLIDAAVGGLAYDSGSQQGTTEADGTFHYRQGETVTFKLGGLAIGKAAGKDMLLLRELDGGSDANALPNQRTVNLAVLLQTLDANGDPSDGIAISAADSDKLKSASLPDPGQASDAFASALAGVLSAAGIDRDIQDAAVARDHLLVAEAQAKGSVTVPVGDAVFSSIQRYVVPDQRVPYTGNDAGIKAAYPDGFPLAVGSSLNFLSKAADGTLSFYGITDRGPNGDSPALTDGTPTKSFPAPAFAPTIVKLTVKPDGVTISDRHELNVAGTVITGLPLPVGDVGSTSEAALSETLLKLDPATDANGLDTEGIVKDPDGTHAWICDEYGPFVAKIELATGKIVAKYTPGTELPAIIAKRQANRGCEGIALTPSGKLYQMIQSTLDIKKNTALFTRIVEIDKGNEAAPATRMFAYPITPADWQDGKAGKAKLGDMVAIDDTHFLVIEQGTFADNKIHNKLFLVDLGKATDLSGVQVNGKELETLTTPAQLAAAGVVTASKYLIADFKDYGWLIEKAEGLALIDDQTIALINDNDFGVAVEARDGDGQLADDVTALTVDDAGHVSDADGTTYTYRIVANKPYERHTQLWVFKLAKPVLQFQPAG